MKVKKILIVVLVVLTSLKVGAQALDKNGRILPAINTQTQSELNLKANLISPTLTGVPLAPTAAAATDTEQIATTAFVTAAASSSNFVDLTTIQTVAGAKTFSEDIKVRDVTLGYGGGNINTNLALGISALAANTTGQYNTAFGGETLKSNIAASNNTAVGHQSLLSNIAGAGNTALGRLALKNNLNNNNTAIGLSALVTNTTGYENTALGSLADITVANITNATAIGYNAKVTNTNTIQLGNTDVTDVKTSGKLTMGTVTYPNTTGSNGQVLTTNGAGAAAWVSPTISGIEAAYPVGAVFISTSGADPGTSLGFGTWVSFGAGRVLLGAGSGYAAGATGGSADAVVVSHDHIFTGDALPAHNHQLYRSNSGYSGGGADSPIADPNTGNTGNTLVTSASLAISAGTPTGTISTKGSSGVDANMQPYIVVYMWNRIN